MAEPDYDIINTVVILNFNESLLSIIISLNNLEKTDFSEIERKYNIRQQRDGLIESVHKN